MALVQGGPKEAGHDRFRQQNDFRYFCNADLPHAYLLLDGGTSKSRLFLPPQPEWRVRSEGPLLSRAIRLQ